MLACYKLHSEANCSLSQNSNCNKLQSVTSWTLWQKVPVEKFWVVARFTLCIIRCRLTSFTFLQGVACHNLGYGTSCHHLQHQACNKQKSLTSCSQLQAFTFPNQLWPATTCSMLHVAFLMTVVCCKLLCYKLHHDEVQPVKAVVCYKL